MTALVNLACVRCGQLPRKILPGPGHCTCPRDKRTEARRRVNSAHVDLCAGRATLIRLDDLYHADPILVAELLCDERIAVQTTTVLYYRAASTLRD